MLYSKSAHQAGASGFFFADDKNAPADSIAVTDAQIQQANNLPAGSSYAFDANGQLVVTNPTSAFLLQQAQAAQIAMLALAYQSAIVQPVNFTTAAGVAKNFQADANSVNNLQSMLAACTPAGKTPAGFYWVAADNTQVPFTLTDMQGLAAAIGAQGWTAFQHLQTQKSAVLAATTVSAVNAISW